MAEQTGLPVVVKGVLRADDARRSPVYVDGGARSGLDLLSAWALGADAVFLGRLPVLALADASSIKSLLTRCTT